MAREVQLALASCWSGAARLAFDGRHETKRFAYGTHRARDPAETLTLVQSALEVAGITRLANITHLDRIGIPVVLSVRPNGLFLGSDAGKGNDLTAAKVSAGMEGIERWRAETGDFESFRTSYDGARTQFAVIPEARLPFTRSGVLSSRWAYRWTLGWDLMNQTEVAVPTLRVELPSQQKIFSDLGWVVWDSSGLASGNTLWEAVHSGLLECVERDAITCNKWAIQNAGYSPPLLDLETVNDPAPLEILEKFRKAGVEARVADCTIDTGIPAYWAIIVDRAQPGIGVFGGHGAHTDPGVALCRALAEAAQSRLIFIAGSRDDIFKRDLLRLKRNDDSLAHAFESFPDRVNFQDARRLATPTFDGDVANMVDRLWTAGIEQVIVCDLSFPDLPVAVVRVVVPGLEGYMAGLFRAGDRAHAFAKSVKQ